jgi:hypothetical protein
VEGDVRPAHQVAGGTVVRTELRGRTKYPANKRELLSHRAEVIGRSIGCGPARRLLRLQPLLLVPGYRGHLHTSPRIWRAHPGAVAGMMQHGRQKSKIFGRRSLSTAQLVKCYGGVSQKSFPSAFSEVRFSVVPPLLVAPPNRPPRQRLYTPSPVKELPKGTGGLRRLPPLDLGDGGPETTHEG